MEQYEKLTALIEIYGEIGKKILQELEGAADNTKLKAYAEQMEKITGEILSLVPGYRPLD